MKNKHLKFNYKIDDDLAITETRDDDVHSIVLHINDREIYENTLTIPYPYTLKDAEYFIDISRQFEDLNGFICNYAIRLKGEMIGGIGFLFNYGIESHKSEFGYWISKMHRRKGIMKKVIYAFTDIAFNEQKLTRIEANVFPENIASQKLLINCGFIKEGLQKSTFVKEDRLKDSILFALVKP